MKYFNILLYRLKNQPTFLIFKTTGPTTYGESLELTVELAGTFHGAVVLPKGDIGNS